MLACILQGYHTVGSALVKHRGPSSAWVKSSGRVERSLSREGFTWLSPGGLRCRWIWFFFWLCWALVAARGLSQVSVSGGYSSLQCQGSSLQWLLFLWSTGCEAQGLSCCSTQTQWSWSGWDLPRPGIEPLSPILTGRFLSTGPGKSGGYDFDSSSEK